MMSAHVIRYDSIGMLIENYIKKFICINDCKNMLQLTHQELRFAQTSYTRGKYKNVKIYGS